MKAIKVNADYELVLFTGQLAPRPLNEAIEFLPFFLQSHPVLSTKTYHPDYLNYIESISSSKPATVPQGEFENWWGLLKDIPLEKKLNSKLTSTGLLMKHGWCEQTFVINEEFDEDLISWDRHYILKDPHGMSGQKFEILSGPKSVKDMIKKGPVILEPLFNRIHDFSHYVFPDNKVIAYQNFVDSRFQYKGSIYPKLDECSIEDFPFYPEITSTEWKKFQDEFHTIIDEYRAMGAKEGFSVDSFTYLEDGVLKIRTMSEVNYRRTMGLVAYELGQKYAKNSGWTLFVLMKPQKFSDFKQKLETLLWTTTKRTGVIILAPGDSRFSMLCLVEENEKAGHDLIEKLNALLPSGEFPIKIENNFPGFFG